MKIHHFFKQSSYHLGEQIESVIALENGEQEQILSQISVVLRLQYFIQKEKRVYTLQQEEFPELSFQAYQRKHVSISCELDKDLLVTSEHARYFIETEVETTDGRKFTQQDQIPVLPPKSILYLFTALKQLGWTDKSIKYNGDMQFFGFAPKSDKESIRFYEFAIVFGNRGIRLLFTFDINHEIISREVYLFDHWFDNFQQFKEILQHVINPIRMKQESTIKSHNYQKWIQSATVLGSRFAEMGDLSTHESYESPPLKDLGDLRLDIFDEDEDED